MRRIWMALFLVLLPAGAAAQDPPAPPADVATELAHVNATLQEIAALLNRQSDAQSIDLLMKRVQLAQTQVTELERQIRTDESELRGLESQRDNVEMQMKTIRVQEDSNPPSERSMRLEAFSEQWGKQLQRIRLRASQLQQEMGALQSDLASRQEDLRGWQAVLDRKLSKQAG